MGTSRITTESIAAESSNLCASFCWQPTLITASSYWVNFPIVRCRCWPFCSTISTPMLLHCALHWFCSIPSETTGSLQIGHENIRSLMLLHVIEPWKPLQVAIVFFSVFSVKKITRQKSIKNPYYKLLSRFFFGSHCLTKLDCYDLLLHNVTGDYKIIGFRDYSGPQGLAFCSGNSDQDEKSTFWLFTF